ncbi:MAG TPA: VOC family protein [Bryobacteraceae bacterium]|nr:VOC family protein [Bryobacteraceae bacterium]
MPKKIDPLNKKNYSSITVMLCVADIKAAVSFYQKAFGFEKRMIMNGPDGKPNHAELTMRGNTLMLGAANEERHFRTAKALGGSPATLYLMVEDADKVFAKAVKTGATPQGEVMDMFWGDRAGMLVDPDGYMWMVATHKSEPTPQEMKKAMKEQAKAQEAAASQTA